MEDAQTKYVDGGSVPNGVTPGDYNHRLYVNGYNPFAHIPAGHIITPDQEAAIFLQWQLNKWTPITADQWVTLVGEALPTVSLKVEFGTGEFPVRRNERANTTPRRDYLRK